ncbi:MAG: helix-turn-helix domain-containing protein [Saprospiraceae bacterium]
MKPIFEEIQPDFGNSFACRWFSDKDCSNLPYWHSHPEYEIVWISNGAGKRHIADHISYFDDGDLVFLGPNVPHMGFAQGLHNPHKEVVVQMKEDFLGPDFLSTPEMHPVKQLFERAKSGICYFGRTRWEVGHRLQKMIELDSFDRLLELLRILQLMAHSTESNSLNINYKAIEVKPQEQQRMRAINDFVEHNFCRQFSIGEVATSVNMTPPAFCRFFKKMTHKTFTTFLNEYRIAHVCNLLSGEHTGITEVSYQCGFNNLSHFNKLFKSVTGKTPTAYRRHLRKFVITPMAAQ